MVRGIFNSVLFLLISPSYSMFGFGGQELTYNGCENLPGEVEANHADNIEQSVREGQLFVVDRVIPPQTFVHFMEAISWQAMPGDVPTALKFPTPEEVELITTPYSAWALPPHKSSLESTWEAVSVKIGSHDDDTGLQVVEKNIHIMKVRLWEGMVPMSDNRWRQKGLDKPVNFDEACQHLSAVVDAFSYLNMEEIQTALRKVFNNIASELKTFEDALNALRETRSESLVSVTALWEEYIRLKWSISSTRAYDWVLGHVEKLRAPLIEQLRQHEPPSFEEYSTEQWNVTNKLHLLSEIMGRAAYTVILPMNGYTGYTPSDNLNPSQSLDINVRKQWYKERLKWQTESSLMGLQIVRGATTGDWGRNRRESRGLADPEDMVETYQAQVDAQRAMRHEIAGSTVVPLVGEDWILSLKRQMEQEEFGYENWGFLIYRITYDQPPADWDAFVNALQKAADDWGEGIMGSEDIKNSAQLKWIDGREVGIAEGDFIAAKRHFLGLKENDYFLKTGLQDDILLAVDARAVASFRHLPSETIPPLRPEGDYEGFITAIEADFDPEDPGEHAEESPGFSGNTRIAGGVIWDLWALAKAQIAYPEDVWPLAMHHPWQVYGGPVVTKQRELWDIVIKSVETTKMRPPL